MRDFIFFKLKKSPVLQNKAKPLFHKVLLNENKNGRKEQALFFIQPLQLFRRKIKDKISQIVQKTCKAVSFFSLLYALQSI